MSARNDHIIKAVACPHCEAATGEDCRSKGGRVYTNGRIHRAREKAAPEPEPSLAAIERGHKALRFDGWRVYTNTGDTYRRWTFQRDVEEVEATKGYWLHDLGPASGDRRFHVVSDDNTWGESYSADQMAAPFFLGDVPEWNPPRGVDIELRDAVKDLAKSVSRLITTAEVAASAVAAEVAASTRNSKQKKPEPKKERPQNEYLRLAGDFEYNSGDPYRQWEFLVDVPEVPASRVQDADPPHAIAGDILREEADEDLTPFQLRRAGRRIGDPEWWQVRHLFAGLKGNEAKRSAPEGSEADGHPVLLRVLPNPSRIRSAYIARRDIPEAGIVKGDVLVQRYGGSALRVLRDAATGHVRQLPRSLFESLTAHLDGLECADDTDASAESLRKYLSNVQARNGKDETSPIFILRPYTSDVSEPIKASSDAEAIFELLYQTTRRNPPEPEGA